MVIVTLNLLIVCAVTSSAVETVWLCNSKKVYQGGIKVNSVPSVQGVRIFLLLHFSSNVIVLEKRQDSTINISAPHQDLSAVWVALIINLMGDKSFHQHLKQTKEHNYSLKTNRFSLVSLSSKTYCEGKGFAQEK